MVIIGLWNSAHPKKSFQLTHSTISEKNKYSHRRGIVLESLPSTLKKNAIKETN